MNKLPLKNYDHIRKLSEAIQGPSYILRIRISRSIDETPPVMKIHKTTADQRDQTATAQYVIATKRSEGQAGRDKTTQNSWSRTSTTGTSETPIELRRVVGSERRDARAESRRLPLERSATLRRRPPTRAKTALMSLMPEEKPLECVPRVRCVRSTCSMNCRSE